MDPKKFIIDKDVYIRYLDRDDYEVHIRTYGPLGKWVYKFTRGNLNWRQRRSYAFVSKLAKPLWISKDEK